MTTLEGLKEVRKLLEVPERWTQGTFARNAKGDSVTLGDKTTACLCVSGACWVVGDPVGAYWRLFNSINDVSVKLSGNHAAAYNDTHTHEEVLALIDRAIAKEEKG